MCAAYVASVCSRWRLVGRHDIDGVLGAEPLGEGVGEDLP